jgi:hypothetical protein
MGRRVCVATVLVAGLAWFAVAAEPDAPEPDARQILANVVAQLPREPITLTGQITVTRRRGAEEGHLRFAMFLDLRANPALARYTIRDAFGTDLEELTVLRPPGEAARYEFRSGNPLKPAAMPDMGMTIRETDLSWMDITLQFLWWDGVKRVGRDVVKGRGCHVVDVVAPEGAEPGAARPGQAAPVRVRLWIDEQVPMMLRAEAYDAGGKLVRSLWVKSFKRIRNRWMIKEMEVQAEPAKRRTHFMIDDLQEGAAPAPADEEVLQPVSGEKVDGG